jgi:hypothetical protein
MRPPKAHLLLVALGSSSRKSGFSPPPRLLLERQRLPAVRPPIKLSQRERTKATWPPFRRGPFFSCAPQRRVPSRHGVCRSQNLGRNGAYGCLGDRCRFLRRIAERFSDGPASPIGKDACRASKSNLSAGEAHEQWPIRGMRGPRKWGPPRFGMSCARQAFSSYSRPPVCPS